MQPHIRAHINLTTDRDILAFIAAAQQESDNLIVEDFEGIKRVSASSMLGMMYASAEFGDMYLVNLTDNGYISHRFDDFRA